MSTDNAKGDYELDIPLAFLNPLVTGYKGIWELIKNPQVKLKGGKRALRLTEVMFLTGFPYGECPSLVWE